MAITYSMGIDNVCLFLWTQKVNIAGSLFLALAIYSYFHKARVRNININRLTKKSKFIKTQIELSKQAIMSEKETFQVKEILVQHVRKNEVFEAEMRDKLESINEKITSKIEAVIKVLTDYMLSNDKEIVALKGEQRTTWKTISIYVGFITSFIMLAVSTYMSFKG